MILFKIKEYSRWHFGLK